jgi:hypothetical protein
MNDPGFLSGPGSSSKITIWAAGFASPNQAGNGTLVSGTGPSCAIAQNCDHILYYQSVGQRNLN